MRLKKNEIIEQFRQEFDIKPGQVIDNGKYAPLIIKNIKREVSIEEGFCADAIIEFCIADGPCFKALAEIKTTATPKIISQAAQQLKSYLNKVDDKSIMPVVIVPYMGAEQAKILQGEGISWIDLSGNMAIRAPNVYIERTGRKNLFPDTSPIKKIYEGTSSLVSRALLLKKEPFKSLYEIVNFINERGGNITLGTVSKVTRALEEELLITKTDSGISTANRERLLEKLAEGYENYTKRGGGKICKYAVNRIDDLFMSMSEKQIDYASCGFYAAKLKGLATTDRITVFIKSIDEAKKAFAFNPSNIKVDSEFGQLELIETKNICVWFNVQGDRFNKVVDDIELYLEMMLDTPRGPKIAEILKERILKGQV